MLTTESEKIVTQINQNVFYKEFTFDKNDIIVGNGQSKELADNVLWLDGMMIVIQIKERNSDDGVCSLESWFENKVLKKAKNQIKRTLDILNSHEGIFIKNGHNQQFEIKREDIKQIHNLIIYYTREEPSSYINSHKYYTSEDGTFMHIFHSEDYLNICNYLITPSELIDYLLFRKDLLCECRKTGVMPEQYLLAHYFQNPYDLTIVPSYISLFNDICKSIEEDNSYYLNGLFDSLHCTLKDDNSLNYLHIIRECAKLNRFELKELKERIVYMLDNDVGDLPFIMKRFGSSRTNSGFLIMKLNKSLEGNKHIVLENSMVIFKYKWNFKKCIGLIISKDGHYFDFHWEYIDYPWVYDKELKKLVEQESEALGSNPKCEQRKWYNEYYSSQK